MTNRLERAAQLLLLVLLFAFSLCVPLSASADGIDVREARLEQTKKV
jgi:hypothetical protein